MLIQGELSTSLFILLFTHCTTAQLLKTRSNPLNIDWDPAPSPEDGPPLSAGASRNKALLPAQISGIIGSYVFIVAIVGVALILLGRRLRLQSQRSRRALDVEMVEPVVAENQFYPTPTSPTNVPGGQRNFSWPSPEKTDRNPYIFPNFDSNQRLPGTDPFVDNRVMEADRELMQRDLEDIYAHVMRHEEAKAAGIKLKDSPMPTRINTQVGPQSEPVKAPSTSVLPVPQSQVSVIKKSEKKKPGAIDVEKASSEKSQSRTSSIISALRSPRRKGLRGMQISSPIPTPLSAAFPSNFSEEEPLSPRYYTPPPPPPVPTSQTQFPHQRQYSNDISPTSPSRSIASNLATRAPPSHHHNPSLTSSIQSRGEPLSAQSATSQTPLYPNSNNNNNHSATNSSRALPFRAFEPPASSPTASNVTKTTVLERSTPLSPSGLKTPWSAGAVPYSPYMPMTPLVPITPRLVTKEDRKRQKKEMGRGPVLELIQSDDELWDSAY